MAIYIGAITDAGGEEVVMSLFEQNPDGSAFPIMEARMMSAAVGMILSALCGGDPLAIEAVVADSVKLATHLRSFGVPAYATTGEKS